MRFSQVKVGVIAALLSVSSFAAQEFLNVSYVLHLRHKNF